MEKEITKIITDLDSNIFGKPWFGKNLTLQLEGIDMKMATKKPQNLNHSIAEILHHMMAWRQFVTEKLMGNDAYEVWETDLDWVKIPSLSALEWSELQLKFLDNHKLLMETIEKKATTLWDTAVNSRRYNYSHMLNGIIQHDIYHIGQISIVKKLVQ